MTPIYHDNVSQFQYIAPGRAPKGGYRKCLFKEKIWHEQNMRKWRRPIFGAKRGEWGKLVLLTLAPKWGTKLPQSQSKNDTTDNVKNKAVSRVK